MERAVVHLAAREFTHVICNNKTNSQKLSRIIRGALMNIQTRVGAPPKRTPAAIYEQRAPQKTHKPNQKGKSGQMKRTKMVEGAKFGHGAFNT
jgi:hypothetical protein